MINNLCNTYNIILVAIIKKKYAYLLKTTNHLRGSIIFNDPDVNCLSHNKLHTLILDLLLLTVV